MSRFFPRPAVWSLGILLLLGIVPAAPGQAVVVSARSVDAVLADFDHLTRTAGLDKQRRTALAFLHQTLGAKGWAGVDRRRPFGFYAAWPARWEGYYALARSGVMFVPVTGKTAFLDFLGRLALRPEKADRGLYRLAVPGGPQLFLRFAHRHAYAALKPALIAGKLPAPTTFLTPAARQHTLALSLLLERIPAQITRLLLRGRELLYGGREEQAGGETDAQYRQRLANTKRQKAFLARLARECKELTLTFDADRKRQRLLLDLRLVPKPKTRLAAGFQKYARVRSRFGGLTRNAVVSLVAHFPLPRIWHPWREGDLLKLLEQYLEPRERALMRRLIRALMPTLMNDTYDLAVVLRKFQPGKLPGWVPALQVNNARKLEHLIRDFIKDMPADERDVFGLHWDYARHAGTKIHKADVTIMPGMAYHAYLAIGADVVLLSQSPDLAALKGALDDLRKADRVPAPPIRLEADLWVVFSMGVTISAFAKDLGAFGKVMMKLAGAFPPFGAKNQKVRISLQGGKDLRLRLEVPTQILRAVPKLLEPAKKP
jgi:hypothetical protein